MKKLRRSRIAKFFAGIMILVCAALIVANIIGTFFLMEENLFYATREQMQQKVYSYIYNFQAGDLMQYLNMSESMHSNNDNYKNYHQSELELFRSKYSPENSNIYFEIIDEKGNVLLKNENIISVPYFSFSSIFTSNCDYSENWFIQGGSGKTESVHVSDVTTEVYFEDSLSTTLFNETEHENESLTEQEATTFLSDENVTAPDDYKTPTVQITDNSAYLLEDIIVYNSNSDRQTVIHYYYKDGINFKILGHCEGIIKDLNYDITEISIYQEDFTVYQDENDSPDVYMISNTYGTVDVSVPTKSFSTTLVCNGKEAIINYSYNGTINFNEFQNRLSLTTLIMDNYDEQSLSFEYNQKNKIQTQVRICVPHVAKISDIYKYAESLVGLSMVYKNNIIPVTVADIILFIAAFAFIFWSAGYSPKKEEPTAKGIHAIPLDLYTLLTLVLSLGCGMMIDTSDDLFVVLGIIGLTLLFIGFLYTITVRIRTKTTKSNNVCYRIYIATKKAAEIMNEAESSKLQIALVAGLFLLVSFFEAVFFALLDTSSFFIALVLLILRVIEIPAIVVLLISLLALHNGAKAISQGDISYRIKNVFLYGPIKKHAEYLNNINSAVNNAVEERVKSESLKTELITNVSHDLKTPLTSIVNYIDLLKMIEISDPKAIEYIEVIDRQAQRLKKLTIDIVEASKAATGNIEVKKEATVLNVILLQTNGEYIERLEANNLTLVQEIPENDITISTDGRLLWRIIDNLMNNICKYSMPGTRVYLSLYETEGFVNISFKNISKEKLNISPETLTERFVRGDTSRNTEGSGLGLSIANSLSEILGGTLSIEIDGDLFKTTLSFPETDKSIAE